MTPAKQFDRTAAAIDAVGRKSRTVSERAHLEPELRTIVECYRRRWFTSIVPGAG